MNDAAPKPSLTILDVGHGNSAVLTDDGVTLVIDAGRRNALLEFLKWQGINRLDTILVSHADQDHIEGLISILSSNEFTLGRVRLNSDSMKGTDVWDDLVFLLDDLNKKGGVDLAASLIANSKEDFSTKAVKVEVLAPSSYLALKGPGSTDQKITGETITSNSISAVIRLVVDGVPSVLFTGDLDQVGLDNLLAEKVGVAARVLVFPHHGGKPGAKNVEQFTKEVVEAVCPNTVIFSIGRGLHSTPRPEVIGALRKAMPNVAIACTQLSENCAASAVPATSPHPE